MTLMSPEQPVAWTTYFATDGASFTATNQTGNVTLLCED